MRAPHWYAVAVRRPTARSSAKSSVFTSAAKIPLLKLPCFGVRGPYHSMILGIKALKLLSKRRFTKPRKNPEVELRNFKCRLHRG